MWTCARTPALCRGPCLQAAQQTPFNSQLLVVAHHLLKYHLCASPQVITCAASDSQDIVLKKSLYQYITTYGTANSDLMLLTINMLLKDCQDQDPTIRGLALRSLCSLTISNLTEYLVCL